jgi:hypothetical protein
VLHPVSTPLPALAARRLGRREFLGLVAAAGVFAACGGGGDDTPTGSESASDDDTIEVTNEFGTFQVPRDPKRVIGWEGRRDLETALALGLSPIAIGSNAVNDGQLAPFVDFDLDGVEVIQQTEPNLELIASLRPDLILTRDSNIEKFLDEVKPLAPLVPVKPEGPWRPDLEQAAKALGREDRLAKVLATYDDARDEVKARHAERIASAAIVCSTRPTARPSTRHPPPASTCRRRPSPTSAAPTCPSSRTAAARCTTTASPSNGPRSSPPPTPSSSSPPPMIERISTRARCGRAFPR